MYEFIYRKQNILARRGIINLKSKYCIMLTIFGLNNAFTFSSIEGHRKSFISCLVQEDCTLKNIKKKTVGQPRITPLTVSVLGGWVSFVQLSCVKSKSVFLPASVIFFFLSRFFSTLLLEMVSSVATIWNGCPLPGFWSAVSRLNLHCTLWRTA